MGDRCSPTQVERPCASANAELLPGDRIVGQHPRNRRSLRPDLVGDSSPLGAGRFWRLLRKGGDDAATALAGMRHSTFGMKWTRQRCQMAERTLVAAVSMSSVIGGLSGKVGVATGPCRNAPMTTAPPGHTPSRDVTFICPGDSAAKSGPAPSILQNQTLTPSTQTSAMLGREAVWTIFCTTDTASLVPNSRIVPSGAAVSMRRASKR